MSLNILTSKNFTVSNKLENKLNQAFTLICNEENISNCSVNLKILDKTCICSTDNAYDKICIVENLADKRIKQKIQ